MVEHKCPTPELPARNAFLYAEGHRRDAPLVASSLVRTADDWSGHGISVAVQSYKGVLVLLS